MANSKCGASGSSKPSAGTKVSIGAGAGAIGVAVAVVAGVSLF